MYTFTNAVRLAGFLATLCYSLALPAMITLIAIDRADGAIFERQAAPSVMPTIFCKVTGCSLQCCYLVTLLDLYLKDSFRDCNIHCGGNGDCGSS